MKAISTDKAPAALGPYSQALESGNIVFVSGQIPINPATGVIPETIEEQAEQAILNAEAILKENGMSLANVIKTTVLLDDLGNFETVNRIYGEHFTAPYPARSCFEVSAIPKGCKIELECIAVK